MAGLRRWDERNQQYSDHLLSHPDAPMDTSSVRRRIWRFVGGLAVVAVAAVATELGASRWLAWTVGGIVGLLILAAWWRWHPRWQGRSTTLDSEGRDTDVTRDESDRP